MIISKDLFIFGEHIFATIIPEGVIQQQQQQQHQQQELQQQNQLAATHTNPCTQTSGAQVTAAPAPTTAPASLTTAEQQVVVDSLKIKNPNPKSSLPSSSASAATKKCAAIKTATKSLAKQEIVNRADTGATTTTRFDVPTATPDAAINLVTKPSNDIARRKEKPTTRRPREGAVAPIKVSGGKQQAREPLTVECATDDDLHEEAEIKPDIPAEEEPLVVDRRDRAKIIAIPAADGHRGGNSLSQKQQKQQHSVAGGNVYNTILKKTTTTITNNEKERSNDFILNMGKVNLGNNNATRTDHAMVTIPFIADHSHVLQLSFQNINVLHNERKILADVSGLVSPGEVLAIMGPSGSGKTTLLDCLSGQRRIDSGTIHLNREPVSKKWRRKICYVLQEEIFFSGLTLRETVMYTALLRLPEKMPKAEKVKQVDRLLEELELNFCQQTKFGDYMNRGLSGGEKKRANIACELLTNPLLMLLDEPTSGLDSHSAISLMKILKRYAIQEQKTVVITVHQPSSQMFHMFDKLLLLYNGRTAYFGEVNNIYRYFEDIGVTIKPHYNPADFVLEQLKSYPDIREKLFAAAKESHLNFLNRNNLAGSPQKVKDDTTTTNNQVIPNNVNQKLHPPHDNLINDIIKNYYKDIEGNHLGNDTMLMMAHNHHNHNESCEDPAQQLWCGTDSQSNFSSASSECQQYDSVGDWLDYPTRFHTQFHVLSSRNFKEAKPRMLSKLNWFQTVGLALMAGAIWFQIPRTEEFLHDLQGWMFFSQTYWMLFALFGALNSFPSERDVVSKERRSGAYRLSAYYLAKMFGELPLVVTLPTVYLMISYPMLGCTSFKLFFLMLVFLLLNTIVAQSVGFFIGACCMDMNVSITLSALYTLATQLFGGYLSSRIPEGLSWIRYTSMIHYAYQNMQILEFREGSPIRCGNPSSYEICKNSTNTAASFIPYEEILRAQNSTSPLWLNTCILMMFFVVFRSLGYAVLRYIRCPKT